MRGQSKQLHRCWRSSLVGLGSADPGACHADRAPSFFVDPYQPVRAARNRTRGLIADSWRSLPERGDARNEVRFTRAIEGQR